MGPTPPEDAPPFKLPLRPRLRDVMGPGLITGASDDDPSGIATYSQVGAEFGYSVGWTLLITYPLMCALQQISATIGRVTGIGLAGNLRNHYPRTLLYGVVAVLLVANTINLGADLGAMAAALNLLVPGPMLAYVSFFAVSSLLMEVFVRYSRYVFILRWLTLSLFAYVATVFVVHVPWGQVGIDLVWPRIQFTGAYATALVAVLGTTISPYLFFWQASQEVEDEKEDGRTRPLTQAPGQAGYELARIRLDTYVGMAFSNLIALFIVTTTAATLHVHGITNIETSAQAAQALRPLAGEFAYLLFSMGIIGTGLLAVPVLSGSAAYALGEAFGWPVGLGLKPRRAVGFYAVIGVATLVGALLNVIGLDPVKALFWSAVVNGVAAVPVMAMTMLMASRRAVMGDFTIGPVLKAVGWLATGFMLLAAVGMFATWGD
jgi:NRAMP (natural resistance-associated macrophage protein)-like metal ion transporter